ncbi:MAG: T9SS type A sorting domain-containing protein [Ignavibacteriales bacterium]|nr:T9SS type A sorting domain-containing protein [Ignavibacteriales bacterium]
MKRIVSKSTLILFACLLAVVVTDVMAQSVKVKREAMSPGRRSSGEPNYTAPAGASAAALDSTTKMATSFAPDVTGQYIIQVSVNGGAKTSADTIFVSTYAGLGSGVNCTTCHPTKNTDWLATGHATQYKRGVSGQLEVNTYGKGMYGATCAKCHTTGWESTTDNGNFGYLAKQAGWDTTWYKGFPMSGNSYMIPNGDTTVWSNMSKNYPAVAAVSSISCESCHGPGMDHKTTGDKTKIASSYDAGVCNQCHDAPKNHRIGSYWAASAHATRPMSKGQASNAGCRPCHNGSAFAAFADNKATPDYSRVVNDPPMGCATCHDPHSVKNEKQLRTVAIDSLANGYKVPTGVAGMGNLCMNCHHARENTVTKVNNQKNKFSDRFYPHYSPQADMFLGANGYEYSTSLTGLNTHGGLKNGCVTCHMAERVIGSSVLANHEMKMTDAAGKDIVTACVECHGPITSFEDIKAPIDYDGNGKIEAVTTEVQGLLDKLKATLPLDATGEPVNMAKDSMLVKNHPRYPAILPAIFNYYFVKNDWSKGIHNTKYAVGLLRASLGMVTGVPMEDLSVPKTFELSQNYPNPFNPTTNIRFSIPKESVVKLAVYDIMGRVVATLVNDKLPAGSHRATWNGKGDDGRNVSSGVYFYHIQAEGFTATKKMALIK